MINRRATGMENEQRAVKYLEAQGYTILERNFRCRTGEIDIVAEDGYTLVFVEVKYRSSSAYGEPEEAVDFRKQRKICRTADYYRLTYRTAPERPCRFDVVAITGGKIRLIKNAFMYRC